MPSFPIWVKFAMPLVIPVLKYLVDKLSISHPDLAAMLNELLSVLGGAIPSMALQSAASHYQSCKKEKK